MNAQPERPTDSDRLVLAGELTIYTVAETLTRLHAHLADRRRCELDLSGLTELDGAGLQLLLWLRETARLRRIELRLSAHGPATSEVWSLLQLEPGFEREVASSAAGGGA